MNVKISEASVDKRNGFERVDIAEEADILVKIRRDVREWPTWVTYSHFQGGGVIRIDIYREYFDPGLKGIVILPAIDVMWGRWERTAPSTLAKPGRQGYFWRAGKGAYNPLAEENFFHHKFTYFEGRNADELVKGFICNAQAEPAADFQRLLLKIIRESSLRILAIRSVESAEDLPEQLRLELRKEVQLVDTDLRGIDLRLENLKAVLDRSLNTTSRI